MIVSLCCVDSFLYVIVSLCCVYSFLYVMLRNCSGKKEDWKQAEEDAKDKEEPEKQSEAEEERLVHQDSLSSFSGVSTGILWKRPHDWLGLGRPWLRLMISRSSI